MVNSDFEEIVREAAQSKVMQEYFRLCISRDSFYRLGFWLTFVEFEDLGFKLPNIKATVRREYVFDPNLKVVPLQHKALGIHRDQDHGEIWLTKKGYMIGVPWDLWAVNYSLKGEKPYDRLWDEQMITYETLSIPEAAHYIWKGFADNDEQRPAAVASELVNKILINLSIKEFNPRLYYKLKAKEDTLNRTPEQLRDALFHNSRIIKYKQKGSMHIPEDYEGEDYHLRDILPTLKGEAS